jgi:8-oxo-dGTP pyrophosphatase MutT (NUDIX family)
MPAEPSRWETYLLRRSSASPVLANLWVFPGGTVRPDDLEAARSDLSPGFFAETAHALLTRPPGGPPTTPVESFGYFVAAARELVEEAGVLLIYESRPSQPEGPRAGLAGSLAELERHRVALEQGAAITTLAADLGIQFRLESLVYYAHWITPEPLPQRFDTRFFLAQLPEGQEASPSAFEMAEGIWIDVATAIQRARAGELPLHFATMNHLRRLAPFTQLAELMEFARSKPVVPIMPAIREVDGRPVPYLTPEQVDAW